MQRGNTALVLMLILLLSALVGGAFFYFRNSSNSELVMVPKTSIASVPAVQTYTGEDFQFEFPGQMMVVADSEESFNQRNGGDARKDFSGYVQYEPPQVASASAVIAKSQRISDSPFLIWIFDNPQRLDPEGWFDKYWYYPFMWGQFETVEKAKLAPEKQEIIGGQKVNYGEVSYQAGSPKYYLIPKDKKMILIRVLRGDGENILKSFDYSR